MLSSSPSAAGAVVEESAVLVEESEVSELPHPVNKVPTNAVVSIKDNNIFFINPFLPKYDLKRASALTNDYHR
jgi:hypothetical protein